jgi:hypothetical protein
MYCMSLKYICLLILINVFLVSSQTYKFSYLEDDKPQIILNFLYTKYNATAVINALATNPVFPLNIEPEYEGRAKMLYDQIIQTKINIDDMKRKGIKESVIVAAEAFLKKTEFEFDNIKDPYIVKSINKSLFPLLAQAQDVYIDVVADYIGDNDTNLLDLVNLIMIAIINV